MALKAPKRGVGAFCVVYLIRTGMTIEKRACRGSIHLQINSLLSCACGVGCFVKFSYTEYSLMAIVDGSLIEVQMNMLNLGQVNLNVWQYRIVDHIGTVTMVQLLEGWWNHVKATYRAIAPASYGNSFVSVRGRELNNPSGDYAEFDVPTAERVGTRAGASGDIMPPFAAVAARLVVGSRVTRPGQKRFPFMLEGDQANGVLVAGIVTAHTTLLAVMIAPMTLGAPAALEQLQPIVVKKDTNGFVTANQDISGYLVNPNVSSQNTRKFGRGS